MEQLMEALPIGETQLREFVRILERYSAGRKKTADRILSAENWWKLRNTQEAARDANVQQDGAFVSRSGWLHNVIASKHADAMDAYPQAVFLPGSRRISRRPGTWRPLCPVCWSRISLRRPIPM